MLVHCYCVRIALQHSLMLPYRRTMYERIAVPLICIYTQNNRCPCNLYTCKSPRLLFFRRSIASTLDDGICVLLETRRKIRVCTSIQSSVQRISNISCNWPARIFHQCPLWALQSLQMEIQCQWKSRLGAYLQFAELFYKLKQVSFASFSWRLSLP